MNNNNNNNFTKAEELPSESWTINTWSQNDMA